jgi:hypothetical protein
MYWTNSFTEKVLNGNPIIYWSLIDNNTFVSQSLELYSLFFNGKPADTTDLSGAPFLAAGNIIFEINVIHAFDSEGLVDYNV